MRSARGRDGRQAACALEVCPHPDGSWFVRAGAHAYAVPPWAGSALKPLAGTRPERDDLCRRLAAAAAAAGLPRPDPGCDPLPRMCARLTDPSGSRPLRRARGLLWLRLPLVPAFLVARAARGAGRLAGWSGLATLAACGAAGYLAPGSAAKTSVASAFGPATWAATAILTLACALIHELGHASALVRSGYPAGGIGVGVLAVVPVLYAEVTAVGLLPRPDKVRVAAAGAAFQLFAGGLLHAAATLPGLPHAAAVALDAGAAGALLAVCWSLLPFVRADGYWMVCDALDVDLDRPVPPDRSAAVALAAGLHRLAAALFLLAAGGAFIRTALPAAGAVAGWARPLLVAAAAALLLLLGRRCIRLACLGLLNLRIWRRGRRPLQAAD